MILNGRYFRQDLESGEWEELSEADYHALEAMLQQYRSPAADAKYQGTVTVFGTGGDFDTSDDLAELFFNPQAYNVIPSALKPFEDDTHKTTGYYRP